MTDPGGLPCRARWARRSATSSCGTERPCACGRPRATTRRADRVLREPLRREPLPALPRLTSRRRGWWSRCSSLTGSSAAPGGDDRRRGGRADRRDRQLGAAARPGLRRGRLRGRRRAAGQGRRHAPAGAARRRRRRAAGVGCFLAEVLPDNRAMLSVFEARASAVDREHESGDLEVALAIVPTAGYLERVDAPRPRRRRRPRWRRSSRPRAVAVIGASPRRGVDRRRAVPQRPGRRLRGRRYPVNRRPSPSSGVRAYASSPTCRARSTSPSSPCPASTCSTRRGTRCGAACGRLRHLGGLRRDRRRGRGAPGRLLALVRSYGGRLIGPNCLGIAVLGGPAQRHLRADARSRRGRIASRRRAARSASSSCRRRPPRGLGLSAFVSIGNKADVSSNDLLEYWEEDPATERRPAVPGVVRQPAAVRAGSRSGSRVASRSWP